MDMQTFVFFARERRIEIRAKSLHHAMRIFDKSFCRPRRRIGRKVAVAILAGLLLAWSAASSVELEYWWALPMASTFALD